MSKFRRFHALTGCVAALAAGIGLLAAADGARAEGSGTANAVGNTTPYSCLACRFVKRGGDDTLAAKPDMNRDPIIREPISGTKPAPDQAAALRTLPVKP